MRMNYTTMKKGNLLNDSNGPVIGQPVNYAEQKMRRQQE
jgi:hypothetical protein